MKCQPTEVSLLLFSLSLCVSTGVQLVADIAGGVIPGWAQPRLSGPCWPPVTPGFDDRLGLLCGSSLSRWGQGRMTMAGNIKPMEAGRRSYGVMGQAGQLSDECSCGHVDLLLCPFSSACHVSWCCLCLGIKTSLTLNKLKKSNKHRQQMYYATDSECTAIRMTPYRVRSDTTPCLIKGWRERNDIIKTLAYKNWNGGHFKWKLSNQNSFQIKTNVQTIRKKGD